MPKTRLNHPQNSTQWSTLTERPGERAGRTAAQPPTARYSLYWGECTAGGREGREGVRYDYTQTAEGCRSCGGLRGGEGGEVTRKGGR